MRIEKEHSYADILLDRELSAGALTGPDRGLLTELVYGVLRRQGTLDFIIDLFSRQKVAKLERAVLVLLRLGLYQAFFLDRVPISAAVNETVNLAKTLAPRAAGFVNAVLRNADRGRKNLVYPDRDREPAAFLATRYSHPAWLAERWLDQLGPAEAERLAETMAAPPPLTVRANTLRISREGLAARLAAEGGTVSPTRYSPDGLHLSAAGSLAQLPSFQEGLFMVQDESSQLAAHFLAPPPGAAVLDLCAAPGGKATHLAQLMGNRGAVTACDAGERKLRFIRDNAERLGINIVTALTLDASEPLAPLGENIYDRVLVDAPCSGLGVIRRHPEGKWWRTPADLPRLAAMQKKILANAADRVNTGGILLYGVCSPDREENEAVVDDFLSQQRDFVLEDLRELFPAWQELFTERGCFRSWPHRDGMDGFFAARLRKQ
jgi:16S rRNA (cytosine967-C5)-methyltransferase